MRAVGLDERRRRGNGAEQRLVGLGRAAGSGPRSGSRARASGASSRAALAAAGSGRARAQVPGRGSAALRPLQAPRPLREPRAGAVLPQRLEQTSEAGERLDERRRRRSRRARATPRAPPRDSRGTARAGPGHSPRSVRRRRAHFITFVLPPRCPAGRPDAPSRWDCSRDRYRHADEPGHASPAATAPPASFGLSVLRERGGDERDQERERREPHRPVDERDRTRRQRDRREEAGRDLGRAPSVVLEGRRAHAGGLARGSASGPRLTPSRPAVRARSTRPPAKRRAPRAGLERRRHPGPSSGFGSALIAQ